MMRDSFYVGWAGNWSPRVVTIHMPSRPELAGLRLLFVTDIHMGDGRNPERQMDSLFARIAAVDADIILWGGDYAEGKWHKHVMKWICALHPRLGQYGVTGNNDHDMRHRRHQIPDGFELLVNEVAQVPVGDASLAIMGVDGVRETASDFGILLPEREKQLRILLSHSPLALHCMPNDPALWPELILCGHTHGGQFNLFGLTPYSIGYERANKHRHFYLNGQHQIGHAQLIVSNGIGTSKLPLRVGAPPELHLVIFTN